MNNTGMIWAVVAAIFWGSTPLLDKIGLAKLSPLAAVLIRNAAITFTAIPILFLSGGGNTILGADKKAVMLVIIGGVLASLFGQWAYYKALQCCEASRVVPIAGTYPLFAFIISILFLGESITIRKALGAILAVLGIFLLGH